jgi:hypothetical protein
MPTTRPRHQITETDEVAHALDVAARTWPEKSRAAQLVALAEEGARSLERAASASSDERRRLVERYAGGFSFEPGYLEELRQDWPE